MKKRIFSILLCIAVCMAMMPLGVYGSVCEVTIAGNSVTEYDTNITGAGISTGSGGYVRLSTDSSKNVRTLTLKNATITGTIQITGNGTAVIELIGENTITANAQGIRSSVPLTIKGNGSGKLTVIGTPVAGEPLGIRCDGSLTFKDVEVDVQKNDNSVAGIYADGILCKSGDITIENSIIKAQPTSSKSGIKANNGVIIAEDAIVNKSNFTSGTTKDIDGFVSIDNKFDKYNIWVTDVRVTSRNASDVLGNGTVSYDYAARTLTLNNANIIGDYSQPEGYTSYKNWGAITWLSNTGNQYLKIELKGANSVTNNMLDGICAYGRFDIAGDGNLTVNGKDNGIYTSGKITIAAGDGIDVTGEQSGISAAQNVNIESYVKATATGESGYGISSAINVDISGKVEAKGTAAAISAAGSISCGTEEIELENGLLAGDKKMLAVKDPNANNGYAAISPINYTLYYNAADGKMYKSYDDTSFKDEFTKDKNTKWSSEQSTGTGYYDILKLDNFTFETAAGTGLKIIGIDAGKTFTIKGTGENHISVYGDNGFGIYTDGSLNFDGGRMYINVKKDDAKSKAVYANGNINLTDCELYDGAEPDSDGEIISESPKGISAGGALVIENADVRTNCIEAAGGISAREYMQIKNLNVTEKKGTSVTKVEAASSEKLLTIYGRLIARFDVNGGKWSDGTDIIKPVPVSLDENRYIILPEEDPVREGYNFTGWLYKDGKKLSEKTEYKITRENLFPKSVDVYEEFGYCYTFYAHWEKASSGGGAVIPPAADDDIKTTTDSATSETTTSTTVKDTKTETVKNEQGQDISKVTATVSEKVADKLVDAAVSNKSDTVEITVKSNDGNKVEQTEVEIPKKALESIAKDTNADLVIKTDSGQVTLDNKALETIAEEAEGDTVKITVNENTQFKEEQKPALDVIGKNGKLFDIKAVIGDRTIHDFKGGKAHVTLPMPEKLKGKDIVIIYINDKGICEILNHTMETVGAEKYIKFTTSHFSTFAVVEKADAEKIIEKQNADKINSLIREAKLKATTSKTTKKSIKVKIGEAKNSNSLIKEAKAMGYTVKYKYYKSTRKASKYIALKTKDTDTYINTAGKKGTKYYYKAKVLVYDGKNLIAQTELKQCRYGVRSWNK